jgi:hypothetical protein
MIWLMIESPSQAFKKVIVAEHKNFVLFLSLFLGVGALFTLMWVSKSGNSFDNLFLLLLFGTFIGLLCAIPLFFLLSGVIYSGAIIAKGTASFKETYGIVGWSLVPVMLSVVCVLPLELSSVGLDFLSENPSGLEVKPVVTGVLLGLDGFFALWTILLAARGISMAHRFRFITGFVVTVISVSAVSLLSVYIYSSFNI